MQANISQYRQLVADLLNKASLTLNGYQPWDPQIHDERFYKHVLSDGSLGLGESYMHGWWDCEQLDEFFNRLLRASLDKAAPRNAKTLLTYLKARLFNGQSLRQAAKNATHHYDLGNAFFKSMLDKRMVYTCGYWKHADNLDQAQEDKLDLTCRKLHLKPGMRILDIGCGWGSLAKFAAEHYDVHVTGINISEPQLQLARESAQGLDVQFLNKDYRNLTQDLGLFDRIVSLGMFEHVGYKNFRSYFEAAKRCLKKNGIFLLHSIGANESAISPDPWIAKYIFPNSKLPSQKQTHEAIEDLFVVEDLHNFGEDYDPTLMAWFRNFQAHWHKFKDYFDDTFYRMWTYYLLSCAGSFRSRKNQLWQMILTPGGLSGGYKPVRFTKEAELAESNVE